MSEIKSSFSQDISIANRSSVTVSGIKSVNSFDENQISVITENDEMLYIEGKELSVKEINLDNGIVEAFGKVYAVYYEDGAKVNRSFFNKIFGNK